MPTACGIPATIAILVFVLTSLHQSAGHAHPPLIVVPFESAPPPYIVIRVPLAAGGCEAMLFDTGTNTTVLMPSLAARVGLSVGREAALESLNGSTRGTKGEARGIGFDDVPPGGSRAAVVAEIPGLRDFGVTLEGLYGHNWMSGTDYLIDYRAKRLVIGRPGSLSSSTEGYRIPFTWSEGRPAVDAVIRAHAVEPFSTRLVLDSGADHVTLFGAASKRMALVSDPNQTMTIDSGFGTREVPTAAVTVNMAGVERLVRVELRSDLNRAEDGLMPTSFFRSVLVSTADGVVVFNTSLSNNPRQDRDRCRRVGPG